MAFSASLRRPRMLRNRRGEMGSPDSDDHSDMLLYLVLVVIMALVLIFTVGISNSAAQNAFDDATCRLSVMTAVAKQMTLLNFAADIRCPPKNVIISSTNNDVVDKTVANAMTGCWHNWLEGHPPRAYFSDDGIYCHVCSTLTFDPPAGSVTGLAKYLASTPQPGFNGTKLEYLAAYSTQDIQYVPKVESLPVQDTYPRNTTYAVMFVYAQGRDTVTELAQKFGVGAAGAGLLAGGVYLIVGVGGAASGPIGWTLLALGGGALAMNGRTSIFDQPPQWTSQIVFAPLDEQTVKALGCQYDPGSKTAT